MDIITLLGIIGSILTIISSLIAIFSTNSQNTSLNHNNFNINNSRNFNSNNSTVNTFISNNRTTHQNIYNNNHVDDSNNNAGLILVCSLIFGGLITNTYLKYLNETLLYLTIFLIISFIISLISLFTLTIKNLITRKNLSIYILMWLPLFFMLIFIHNHFFRSDNLEIVNQSLKSSTTFQNFINTFISYKFEVNFILLQIIGLALIIMIAFFLLLDNIKQLYKGLKVNKASNIIKTKDILWYIFSLIFIFLLVSGYGVELISKFNSYLLNS